jgi:hypothetical protein
MFYKIMAVIIMSVNGIKNISGFSITCYRSELIKITGEITVMGR